MILLQQRRASKGVTLLFVVSLIVLFLLMGTAFVVLASDFFRTARQRAHHELQVRSSASADAVLEKALYDLIREPALDDLNSPLRGHSLLGDMYGYGFKARIIDARLHNSQQFLVVELNPASAYHILDISPVTPPLVSQWAGLVLTVASGPAKGLTTRIVDHQITNSSQQILLLQPDWRDTNLTIGQIPEMLDGAEVVINGRPFSGTGAGRFDPAQPANRAALSNAALQPDQRNRSRAQLIENYLSRRLPDGTLVANHASTNESFDTFDFQNMFLAGIGPAGVVEFPSFHRQALIDQSPVRSDFRAITGPDNGVLVDNLYNGGADGVWIDIGLPSLSHRDGTRFKPLVSYTVIDLDSRINLNAHGHLYASDRQMSEINLLATQGLGVPDSDSLHRGVGYGPPEIGLSPTLLDWSWVFEGNSTYPGRYGRDGKPGEADVRDGWAGYKLFGYPDRSFLDPIPGTVSGDFGSVMDAHGRFAIGYPDSTKDFGVPVHLPVANVGISNLTSEIIDSAYEMSFADSTMLGPPVKFDTPFTPQELEAVLRNSDIDSKLLTGRLRNLGDTSFTPGPNTATYSITTSSFEVPTRLENLPQTLAEVLQRYAPSMSPAQVRDQVEYLLPSEIMRGLPMNVNRPFGDGIDNNGNGIVDEIGESNQITHPNGDVYSFTDALARYDFARHLYIVALLATEDLTAVHPTVPDELLAYRKKVAQWAVNVVDFRDRDSIMTGFAVDLNPWDGWDVDPNLLNPDMLNGKDSRYRTVVWGVERPEMLITEVTATHDRATQDLAIDRSGKLTDDEDDPDDDFDSHLVPRVSVFFELYNPWVINEANSYRPAEFYDADLNGVDLQKRSPDGSPVWRMVVTAPNGMSNQGDLDPDDPANTVHFHRRIYFTEPADDSGPPVFFPESSIRVPPVQPGLYAVVGSAGVRRGNQYVTYFGRKAVAEPLEEQELATTRQISLNPQDSQLNLVRWNFANNQMETVTRRQVVTIPIGLNDGGFDRNLGVSDPIGGYQGQQEDGRPINLAAIADGFKFTVNHPDPDTNFAFDMPIDRQLDQAHYDRYLKDDGLHTGYRTVHLQRLANPLAPYHSLINPYLTIDSSAIDLVVFNGVESKEDPNNQPQDLRVGSYERGSIIDEQGNATEDLSQARHRLLFKQGREGTRFQHPGGLENFPINDQVDQPIGADDHQFSFNLHESLGAVNHAYRNAVEDGENPDQFPFAWLTWNNRPYASQLELANVPWTSSYWLTRLFDVADEVIDIFTPDLSANNNGSPERDDFSGHFPQLFNFYADSLDPAHLVGGLHRVFDFLEVPSRFLGTESYLNPAVFQNDQGLSFNLAAPFDTISNFRYPGKINLNTVLDPRVWDGLLANYSLPQGGGTGISFEDWEASRNGRVGTLPFSNPLRSPRAGNWVPLNSMLVPSVDCGLFRSTSRNGQTVPMFDYRSEALHNNTQRAPYFRYDCRQRLGNLVTGRSSVFAIWITVGYFEVDANENVLDPDNGGRELGRDSGESQRHRAFFIFDRSIPVAFEPGKNHNVDRAVLVRRRIE